LWDCTAALEDQVLKLFPPESELVPCNPFGGDCFAVIDLVLEVVLEALLRNEL
jgi:hypothetical protein